MQDAHDTGTLLEFKYGSKQKPGVAGGWKNDPAPSLLVFHDDGENYIEGINLHYLSYYYVKKMQAIIKRFPGLNGTELYSIVKRTAPFAIKKGYRKYIRASVNSPHKIEVGENLERERDALGRFTGNYREIETKE